MRNFFLRKSLTLLIIILFLSTEITPYLALRPSLLRPAATKEQKTRFAPWDVFPVTRATEQGSIRRTSGITRVSANLDLATSQITGLSGATAAASARFVQEALGSIGEYAVGARLMEELRTRKVRQIPVDFVEDHDRLMDVSPATEGGRFIAAGDVRINFDASVPEDLQGEEYRRGRQLVYTMSLIAGFSASLGYDRPRALGNVVEFYEGLSEEDQKALLAVLERPEVDGAGIFVIFLQQAAGQEAALKEKWITWLVAQVDKDYAYDVEKVRQILREEQDPFSDSAQARLADAVRSTFDEGREDQNVTHLAAQAHGRQQDVVFARFGHAIFVPAIIAAASCHVYVETLRQAISGLEAVYAAQAQEGLSGLEAELQRISDLGAQERVPQAQVERAARKFETQLTQWRERTLEALQAQRRDPKVLAAIAEEKRAHAGYSPTEEALGKQEQAVYAACQALNQAVGNLRLAMTNDPHQESAFVFFGRRLSTAGAADIARIHEGEKAYAGPEFGLEEYWLRGAHNVHLTPSMAALENTDHWIEALPLFVHTEGGVVYIDYEEMEEAFRQMAQHWAINIENAEREGRQRPTLHVLTTESANMTNMIRFWVEEEMSLFNVVRHNNLEQAITDRTKEYRRRIQAAAERIVSDHGLDSEVQALIEQRGMSRAEAALRVADGYADVTGDVTNMCVLMAHGLDGEFDGYLTQHRRRLRKAVLGRLIAEFDLEGAIEEYMTQHPGATRPQAIDRVIRAQRLGDELEGLIRVRAREELVAHHDLTGEAAGFMRTYRSLAVSTARKEIIAEHGLVAQTHSAANRYEATGPNKRYNLVYAPSRVNLGPHQIASVIELEQTVGPYDREAAEAAYRYYSLTNLAGVTVFETPRGAEVHKTAENSIGRGVLFADSNALALLVGAVDNADIYRILAEMNKRGDRIMYGPGEGYGGFCVPKDGLFLKWVISMTDPEVLDKLGVPKALQPKVIALAREIMRSRYDFDDPSEWRAWAIQKVHEELGDEAGTLITYVPDMPSVGSVLRGLGTPEEPQRQVARDIANWALDKMVVGAEQVNRAMPLYKAWLIHQVLAEARARNPEVAAAADAVVSLQASYKPEVQDPRFATAVRIFLGLTGHYQHLLEVMDDEGRRILEEMLGPQSGNPAIGDIRVIDPYITTETFCDELTELSPELEQEYTRLMRRLTDTDDPLHLGLTREQIAANAADYGTRLEEWFGIGNRADRDEVCAALRAEFPGALNFLVTRMRGVEQDYWTGLQGIDVLNLGVPHDALRSVLGDLPRLYATMTHTRPDSAVALVDSPTGAQWRVMNNTMVREWLALGGNYAAIGVGPGIIEGLREEVTRQRQDAQELFDAITAGDFATAQAVYERMRADITDLKVEEALAEEQDARERGMPRPERYRVAAEARGRVRGGLALANLDFGTWLVLGGQWILNGRTEEEVNAARRSFEQALSPYRAARARDAAQTHSAAHVDETIRATLTFKYEKPPEGFRQAETGLGGSLKEREARKTSAAGRMKARRLEAMRATALRDRKNAFDAVSVAPETAFDALYTQAKSALGDPIQEQVPQADFGKFLGYTRASFHAFIDTVVPAGEARDKYHREVDALLTGGELSDASYKKLAVMLNKISDGISPDDNAALQDAARLGELLDIALLVEKTIFAETPEDVWVGVAQFFDATMNNHIFDYTPYHWDLHSGNTKTGAVGYRGLSRDGIFALSQARWQWIYAFARNQLLTRTELRDASSEEQGRLIGDYRGENRVLAVGVEGATDAEAFWFSCARLRDLCVLRHDNYPTPRTLDNVDPAAIDADTRVNDVVMYPIGNTTVTVGLRHSQELTPEGTNLMIAPFPVVEYDARYGREVVHIYSAMMYLSPEEYVRAGGNPADAEHAPAEGILTLVRFSKPVLACSVMPHFTHQLFMSGRLEEAGVPLSWTHAMEEATYDKTNLPQMLAGTDIGHAAEIDWRMAWTQEAPSAEEAKQAIREGDAERGFEGLVEFSRTHRIIIAKSAAQSGGRGSEIFEIRDRSGTIIEENLARAVDFIYAASRIDNIAICDFIESVPRDLCSHEFLQEIQRRFAGIGKAVALEREPQTPLFWYFRTFVAQGLPGTEPDVTGRLVVFSTEGIANVGRGGVLSVFLPDHIKGEWREKAWQMLEKGAQEFMAAIEAYTPQYITQKMEEEIAVAQQHNATPDEIAQIREKWTKMLSHDAAGISTARPLFLMLDWMIKPVYNDQGKIVDLQLVMIEPNIGAGLWAPYEKGLAADRKGEHVRPIFRAMAERGRMYRAAISGEEYTPPAGGLATGPTGTGPAASATGPVAPGTGDGAPVAPVVPYAAEAPEAGEAGLSIAQEHAHALDVEAVHAVIFNGDVEHFQYSLADLLLEAAAHTAHTGSGVRAVGVHRDWLDLSDPNFARAQRCLAVNAQGQLVEITLEEPFIVDSAHLLNMPGRDEQHDARFLARVLDIRRIPVINPVRGMARADSKIETLRVLGESSRLFSLPQGSLLVHGQSQDILLAELRTFASALPRDNEGRVSIFVEPNHGTEGRGTRHFLIDPDDTEALAEVAAYTRTIHEEFADAAIIEQGRGNVFFIDPENHAAGARRIALRVNVSWSGSEFVSEGGFAQVASSPDNYVAAAEQNGEIVPAVEALRNIYYRDDTGALVRYEPTPQEVARVLETAAQAAGVLTADLLPSEIVRFMGIDILLEIDTSTGAPRLVPVVLEANPRPAGIRHIETIPLDLSDGVPAAARNLWSYVEQCARWHRGMRQVFERNAALGGALLPFVLWEASFGVGNELWQQLRGQGDFGSSLERYFHATAYAATVLNPAEGPVVIARTPGRARAFGGHTDVRGLGGVTVNMSTQQEIITVLQSVPSVDYLRDRGIIEIYYTDPQFMDDGQPLRIDLSAPDVNPPQNIRTLSEWDAWTSQVMAQKREQGIRLNRTDELLKGLIAFLRTDLGDPDGTIRQHLTTAASGKMKFVLSSNLPYTGGYSSSSAVMISFLQALNERYGLGLSTDRPYDSQGPELAYEAIDAGFCEYYNGTRAGTGDHSQIVLGREGMMTLMSSFPTRVIDSAPFPQGTTLLMAFSGVSRENAAEVSEKLREEPEAAIKGRTGIGCILGVLYLRHNLVHNEALRQELAAEGINPDHVAQALSPQPEAGDEFGLLREFNQGGALADIPTVVVYRMLKTIPVRASRGQILEDLPEFGEQLAPLFAGHDVPAHEYPVRAYTVYGIAEDARGYRYMEYAHEGNIDQMFALMRTAHNGDRIVRHEIVDHVEQGVVAVDIQTPYDVDTPVSDEAFDRYIAILEDPSEYTPNEVQSAQIYNQPGTFERSIEPIDLFCDLVEVFNHRVGQQVAVARVAAAGLGGSIAVLVRDEYREQLEEFLRRHYYGPQGFQPQMVAIKPGQGAQILKTRAMSPETFARLCETLVPAAPMPTTQLRNGVESVDQGA